MELKKPDPNCNCQTGNGHITVVRSTIINGPYTCTRCGGQYMPEQLTEHELKLELKLKIAQFYKDADQLEADIIAADKTDTP